jgi:uncharacterized membrane protein YbaN (DUF454 family)
MTVIKVILIVAGTVSLGVGIVGIVVPGLPTTPFLLLTAGLYMRSSDTLYQYLVSNKYVGSYINDFRTNKGMSLRAKIYAILMMWTMITLSCIFLVENTPTKLLIISIGILGTIIMGFIIPTINNSISNKNKK